MKKITNYFIAVFICFIVLQSQQITLLANDNISIVIDGEKVNFEQPPIIQNGRTLVPFRPVFEQIGMGVQYEPNTKTITATGNNYIVKMQINNKNFNVTSTKNKINGGYLSVNYTFDVPPQIINGKTYIPVGFIFDSIDYSTNWDASTKTVYIVSEDFNADYELEQAIILNNHSKVKTLLENGANPNSELFSIPALQLAQDYNMAQLLISYNADVNATHISSKAILGNNGIEYLDKNTKYNRPIIFYRLSSNSNENDVAIIELFLKNGLDMNAKNDFGLTPLEYATYKYNYSVSIEPSIPEASKAYFTKRLESQKKVVELFSKTTQSNTNISSLTKGSDAELDLLTNVTNTMLNIAKTQTSIATDFKNKKYDAVITNSETVISSCESLKNTDLTVISSELNQIKNNFANSTIKTSEYMIDSATEMKNGNYSGAYVSAIYGAIDTDEAVRYINEFSDFILEYYKGMY